MIVNNIYNTLEPLFMPWTGRNLNRTSSQCFEWRRFQSAPVTFKWFQILFRRFKAISEEFQGVWEHSSAIQRAPVKLPEAFRNAPEIPWKLLERTWNSLKLVGTGLFWGILGIWSSFLQECFRRLQRTQWAFQGVSGRIRAFPKRCSRDVSGGFLRVSMGLGV